MIRQEADLTYDSSEIEKTATHKKTAWLPKQLLNYINSLEGYAVEESEEEHAEITIVGIRKDPKQVSSKDPIATQAQDQLNIVVDKLVVTVRNEQEAALGIIAIHLMQRANLIDLEVEAKRSLLMEVYDKNVGSGSDEEKIMGYIDTELHYIPDNLRFK